MRVALDRFAASMRRVLFLPERLRPGFVFRLLRLGLFSLIWWAVPAGSAWPGEPAVLSPSAVYTDREASVSLGQAGQAFRSGDLVGGSAQLRRLFGKSADSFVATENGLRGARAAAETVLSGQVPSVRQFVEASEGAEAAAAFAAASAAGEVSLFREVARRFYHTPSGCRAVDRLASAAFDRGDFATASRLWEGLSADPQHARRLTPATSAKLLVALRRAGRDGRASNLAVQLSGVPLSQAGKAVSVGSLLRGLSPAELPFASAAEDAAVAGGLTAPVFPPTWVRDCDQAVAAVVELWAGCRREQARPIAMTASAVVTGDELVVREMSRLVAVDRATGGVRWTADAGEPGGGAASLSRDIHGLTRFEERYAGNGVVGRLATDGERIYVAMPSPVPQPQVIRTVSSSTVPNYGHEPEVDRTNRIVAIPLGSECGHERQPVWEAGGPDRAGATLGGRYFFGPPTDAGDCLVAIAEHKRCLSLVALERATGALLWEQPLGFVARPAAADDSRAGTACVPVVAEGIAVCDCGAGFVVAVDLVREQLLWAFEYAATEPAGEGASRSARPERRYGDASFASPAVIRGDKVVLMPHDSRFVHCIDLRSGTVRWSVPREDGFYVGCMTDSAVLVVGRSFCRSLSIASGRELWSARFGSPSGTGVATGDSYLLPLESGLIACLDLTTGRRRGFELPRDKATFAAIGDEDSDTGYSGRWRPGNLFTDGTALFSVGPGGVARLETAARWLATSAAGADPLEVARAELAAGHIESARPRLESLEKSGGKRDEARRLLRELHYLRLSEAPVGGAGEALAEIDRLSLEAPDRARFLLNAAEGDVARGNGASLAARIEEFSRLHLNRPVPMPDDATHLVTAASWISSVLGRGAERPDADSTTGRLESEDAATLDRRLLRDPYGPAAQAVRLELARRALADGEIQRAELLLLRNLADGEHRPSREELDGVQRRFGLPAGGAVGPSDEGVVTQVRVTGRLWEPADDAVCRAYGRSRRGFLTRNAEPFRVVDRGDSRRSRLAVLDLDGGVCLGEVALESRLNWPSLGRQPAQGHFVPVVTVGKVYGLSLLEAHRGSPMWAAELPGNGGFLPQLGPYGPGFCTVQTKRELTILDPGTGATLWRRTELPTGGGLHGDEPAGLFGDDEALVLLSSEANSYTVYQTRTGNAVGGGQLPAPVPQTRKAYGRKLYFVEADEDGAVARVYDPLTSRDDLRVPCTGRMLQTAMLGGEIVLCTGGRLLIYDVEDAKAVLDLRLDPEDVAGADQIWAFSDESNYYLNFYLPEPDRFERTKLSEYVDETPLAANHVHGRLIAVDRVTGEVRWSRRVDRRSILDPSRHQSPFLVALANVRDWRLGRRTHLLVEAIDKRTGATLAVNDALVPDQPLQFRRGPGRVELAGMNSTVSLDFGGESEADVVASRPQN